jgi:hypothetical protein
VESYMLGSWVGARGGLAMGGKVSKLKL